MFKATFRSASTVRVLRVLCVLGCLNATAAVHALDLKPFDGDWQIADDDHHERVVATIRIQSTDREVRGTLQDFVVDPGEPPAPVCEKCPEPFRGRPLRGLSIIWGLKPDDDALVDGYLLDPIRGKVVRCQMRLSDDHAALRVRVYIGVPLLGGTMTWRRAGAPGSAAMPVR